MAYPSFFGVQNPPDAIFYEEKMHSSFNEEKLKQQINSRGWSEVYVVKKGHCYLTPGLLDYLAHHGPSFITDALP